MSKYQFAISSGPDAVRQAGVVESPSFDEAVTLLSERVPVQLSAGSLPVRGCHQKSADLGARGQAGRLIPPIGLA